MKLALSIVLFGLSASAGFAQSSPTSVRWQNIVGVITGPGIDNPVAGISSGTLGWNTKGGTARVNFQNGNVFFFVEGLVLNGGNATGTPGPITNVIGTLVCNAGTTQQAVIDTPVVPLSPLGNAEFSGTFASIPTCSNPLFLIRIAGGAKRWLATGSVAVTSSTSNDF